MAAVKKESADFEPLLLSYNESGLNAIVSTPEICKDFPYRLSSKALLNIKTNGSNMVCEYKVGINHQFPPLNEPPELLNDFEACFNMVDALKRRDEEGITIAAMDHFTDEPRLSKRSTLYGDYFSRSERSLEYDLIKNYDLTKKAYELDCEEIHLLNPSTGTLSRFRDNALGFTIHYTEFPNPEYEIIFRTTAKELGFRNIIVGTEFRHDVLYYASIHGGLAKYYKIKHYIGLVPNELQMMLGNVRLYGSQQNEEHRIVEYDRKGIRMHSFYLDHNWICRFDYWNSKHNNCDSHKNDTYHDVVASFPLFLLKVCMTRNRLHTADAYYNDYNNVDDGDSITEELLRMKGWKQDVGDGRRRFESSYMASPYFGLISKINKGRIYCRESRRGNIYVRLPRHKIRCARVMVPSIATCALDPSINGTVMFEGSTYSYVLPLPLIRCKEDLISMAHYDSNFLTPCEYTYGYLHDPPPIDVYFDSGSEEEVEGY